MVAGAAALEDGADGTVVVPRHGDAGLRADLEPRDTTPVAQRGELGDAWEAGMNPDIPESKVLDNPYTYTDYADASTHHRVRD